MLHGRPDHPQTQGQDERFHRTLAAEALRGRGFADLAECQLACDAFRPIDNHLRPPAALALATPARRYQPSPRRFPDPLPALSYGPDALVRKVHAQGELSFRHQEVQIGRACRGSPVALRPTADPVTWEVDGGDHPIRTLDRHPVVR